MIIIANLYKETRVTNGNLFDHYKRKKHKIKNNIYNVKIYEISVITKIIDDNKFQTIYLKDLLNID